MKNKSVQDKMSELNDLVAWFDGEDFVLEQATDKFKQAEKLAEEIRQDLKNMKNEIEVLARKFDQEA